MKNNFQKLEEQMIQEYGSPPREVKQKIDHALGVFGIFGTILDLFVTKMLKTIISLTGGNDKREEDLS